MKLSDLEGKLESKPTAVSPDAIDAALDLARDDMEASPDAWTSRDKIDAVGLSPEDIRILAYADERLLGAIRRIYETKRNAVLDELKSAYSKPDDELAKLARLYQTWQAVLDDLEHFPKACREVLQDAEGTPDTA